MKRWTIFLLFISMATHASSGLGLWGTTCDEKGFSIEINNKPNTLIVNDNQIVINFHLKEVDNNNFNIFYDGVADLGRGGMNLDWRNISLIKPVAELSIINQHGKLHWKGFYDDKKMKYFWTNDPDFVQSYAEDGVINLHKCEK
ncbi:hypothetical protein Q9R34_05270 [Enterobacter sp. BRE11]|nr:hypothetical protein [Enterobacter sp. BRE11]